MARKNSVVMSKAETRAAKAELKAQIKEVSGFVKTYEKDIKTLDSDHAKAVKALIKSRDAEQKNLAKLQDRLSQMDESTAG